MQGVEPGKSKLRESKRPSNIGILCHHITVTNKYNAGINSPLAVVLSRRPPLPFRINYASVLDHIDAIFADIVGYI